MKIESVKPTENRFIKKIKQTLSNRFSKLKTLAKDVFEREEQQYLIINGKNIKEKDLPNFVTGPSDIKGITWSELEFYPEDLEKMKKMKTARERINYKKRLIEQRHFYENGIL